MSVSLLQFADDTIFICKTTIQNVNATKAILRLFELVSGLKINFFKSTLVILNAENNFISTAVSILNCKTGGVPFNYLGIPVGANPRRLETWTPLIDCFKKCMSSWKNQLLSFGGRVVLLKAVISSLPLYLFSFYLTSSTVIKKLNSLQTQFL